ncbi:MAG: alanine racemase [Candidatus Latescibacterota bacterium]
MSEAPIPAGIPKAELDTPALLVDLDTMEANIARIACVCREHGVGWRPHTKSHKTPQIARRQLEAGALGVTCAKLGEAEVMARAGVRDILIANQVVGGIFSDVHYRTHFHSDFQCALTVLCTVTSRPTPTRIILDAGLKSMSADAALPQPLGLPPIRTLRFAAEHLTLELEEPAATPAVGDRVELIAGYSDTTVHLHEHLVATRQGRVEAVWPVAGRGKSQ